MILLTGSTGFIGRALTRQLVENGLAVRVLLRPSKTTPRLPTGIAVEMAVSGLGDIRGLRAAMRGVDTIFHLAGGEGEGGRANLQDVDITGTSNLCQAAADAGVQRLIYISHLGADRASGFPVLKAKGIAEEYIRNSGVPYTIIRGSLLFGVDDGFTTGLAMLLAAAPGLLPLPGDGKSLIQPLWVEDLITCLVWTLDEPAMANRTYEIGGSEYFTLRHAVEIVMRFTKQPRLLFSFPYPLLRALTVTAETVFPRFPATVFWLDYLAFNRTCPVNSVSAIFGLMPARFETRLDHLLHRNWRKELVHRIFSRHA